MSESRLSREPCADESPSYEIINFEDVSWPYYERFEMAEIVKRRRHGTALDLITAFDIESTNIRGLEEAVMYVWQFGTKESVVYGRTWEEFYRFINVLAGICESRETKLIVYVHNLSYEFQFLRTVLEFESEDVFLTKPRKIIKCVYRNCIEFRCSYFLSNMSLDQFTAQMKVKHGKLSGEEFDYAKERYSWTELTSKELKYCCHDVVGLCEAIDKLLEINGDNLLSVPLTSTGFVRRDAKRAMKKVPEGYVDRQLPDVYLYQMLREAFRGGNTHANRYYAGKIIGPVFSYDRSSSYPDVQCNDKFPTMPFHQVGDVTPLEFERFREREKALLFRASFTGIRLKDKYWGCPYIPLDKSRGIINYINDNGRILEADFLSITITDIDYLIIESEYTWQKMDIYDLAYSSYYYLPKDLVRVTIDYFQQKTRLKDVPGQEEFYVKNKNKLNSIYGMMAQNPVRQKIVIKGLEYVKEEVDIEGELLKSRVDQFMPYQWGVWVTAHARYRLEEGIRLAKDNFVYTDTDCVKSLKEIDFAPYNKLRIKASKKSGAVAKDRYGIEHYMGTYDMEKTVDRFVTWGAKKYCSENGGKLKVTVSGVVRKNSASELAQKGGLEAFRPGLIFREAGGIEAKYNDHPAQKMLIGGREILLTSNIYLCQSTYQLGITSEYEKILSDIDY